MGGVGLGMEGRREYTAPPITDAIIEIRFAEELSAGNQRKLRKRLARNYETALDQKEVNVHVNFQAAQADFSDSKSLVQLASLDQADRLVLRTQGLAWQRLAPYEGWDTFFARVQADFEAHHETVGLRKIERLGVRYVNRLDIPSSDGEVTRYEDYLTINVEVPWPTIENYQWRVEKLFPESDLLAVLQSYIVAPEVPGTGAFILDIDVIKQQNLPVKMDDLWADLHAMRELKNNIFELCITDRARGMFHK